MGDGRRLMLPVEDGNKFMSHVASCMEKYFPMLKACHLTMIISLAGCDTQVAHTDGTIDSEQKKLIDAGVIPLSALVAIERQTSVIVWRGSHNVLWLSDEQADGLSPMIAEVVHIPPYHVCLFRQDLVHAGNGYEGDHVRGHFLLNPRDRPICNEEVTTQHVDCDFFRLQK